MSSCCGRTSQQMSPCLPCVSVRIQGNEVSHTAGTRDRIHSAWCQCGVGEDRECKQHYSFGGLPLRLVEHQRNFSGLHVAVEHDSRSPCLPIVPVRIATRTR